MSKIKRTSDRIIDGLDNLGASISRMFFGEDAEGLIDLLSSDGDGNFIVEGGVYLSLLRVDGFHSVVGEKEFATIVKEMEEVLKVRLDKGCAHSVKVFFESDPDATRKHLELNARGYRAQADAMGLNIDDLIEEKIEVNSKLCQIESFYLALYTLPSILPQYDSDQMKRDYSRDKKQLPSEGKAQPFQGRSTAFRNAHESTVRSLEDVMKSVQLIVHRVNILNALREVKRCTDDEEIAESYIPDSLYCGESKEAIDEFASTRPGVRLSEANQSEFKRVLRTVTRDNDLSFEPLMPRPLGQQLCPNHMYSVAGRYLVVENRVHAPFHVNVHSDVPKAFDTLINSLPNVPFRIAFTLSPDGLAQDFVRSDLASMAQWMSLNNKQITKTREQFKDYEDNGLGTVIGLSITGTTWAPLEETLSASSDKVTVSLNTVRSRFSKLKARFNDWGGVSIDSNTGNPIETFYSTIPGLRRDHTAEVTPYPLIDAVALMPFTRVSSAWKGGPLIYRTNDGKPVFYTPQSERQSSAITLIIGPMGFGKSSQMNALNLGFTIMPSESGALPYNRILDFGPSSAGYINLVKSSLPPERAHEAMYHKLMNTPENGVNPFGTALGSREPLTNHLEFLANFMKTAADSLKEYPSLDGLIKLCIKQSYLRYTDKGNNPSAKRYDASASAAVNDAITKYGITANDGDTTWWSVVDALFDAGDIRSATLAQRHAVPTLPDVATIAASESVRAEYNDELNGNPITQLLARSIRECIDRFPFVSGVTQLDFENSPIVALNLRDITSPKQGSEPDRDTAIVFLVALRLLTEDFFIDEDFVSQFHTKYQRYHADRIRGLKSIRKGMSVDERHRVKGVTHAEAEFDRIIWEGRKYKIAMTQASPQWDNFSPSIQEMANTIIFCGVDAEVSVDKMAKFYGLGETHAKILPRIKKPGRFGAEMLAIFKTDTHGRQVLRLMNTEGPLMLCAMASEAEDRTVYTFLVNRCSDEAQARRIYAHSFPSGSVKGELRKLEERRAKGTYEVQASDGSLLVDLANMAIEKYRHQK